VLIPFHDPARQRGVVGLLQRARHAGCSVRTPAPDDHTVYLRAR
jgi:hypothetical protein